MSVDGDLDLATGPMLADTVAGLVARTRPRRLVVDMSGVRFLDSSGIRALLHAYRTATDHGASFQVRRPAGFVARVLRVAAVDQLLDVVETDPES